LLTRTVGTSLLLRATIGARVVSGESGFLRRVARYSKVIGDVCSETYRASPRCEIPHFCHLMAVHRWTLRLIFRTPDRAIIAMMPINSAPVPAAINIALMGSSLV
jgi:hypothetical protein